MAKLPRGAGPGVRRTLAGLNNEESFSGAPMRVRPAWRVLFLPRWGLSPPSHPGLRRSSSMDMSGLGLQTALGVFPERPLGPRVHPRLGKKNVVVVFYLLPVFQPSQEPCYGWMGG